MALNPGEEFKAVATPGQALLRKLAYLATQDTDSVLTGRSSRTGRHQSSSAKSKDIDTLVAMSQAEALYQATVERVTGKLDMADEAAARALEDITHLLAENARRREELLRGAYRLDDGTAVFLSADGHVYDEHGQRLSAEDAAGLPEKDLRARPSWEQWDSNRRERHALERERDDIHRHNDERETLRERIEEGELSQEELEALEREIERDMPGRMRSHYQPEPAANPGPPDEQAFRLSDEELTGLDNPRGSAAGQLFGAAGFESAPAAKSAFATANEPPAPAETTDLQPAQGPAAEPGRSA